MTKAEQGLESGDVANVAPRHEITKAMIEAGSDVIDRWYGVISSDALASDIYSAMVRASTLSPHL